MNKRLIKLLFLFCVGLMACSENEGPKTGPSNIYFPPLSGNTWESLDPKILNWNIQELDRLDELLESNGTRAFILLKNGKIVREVYFGLRLTGNQPFDQNSLWYWASAGKTLTATLIGLAQEEGKLTITESSSKYLGEGWTSMSLDQEKKITIWHQLTMTSGLDENVGNRDDYTPINLKYLADPGSRWAYHNAPYTLLDKVIEGATGSSFSNYFNQKLGMRIGMTGSWQKLGFNNVFFSNARSMARFGLLLLAEGVWDGQPIIKDTKYLREMINSSQDLNKSYGYLWWLNGKPSFMLPIIQNVFQGSWAPNAPNDMFCGLGKDGQYVCVVPSLDLVLVRMGENPDQSLVPLMYLDEIWQQLNKIFPEN
ncbi:serine hydrolase domain-containing protein [Cecembia rubra]|uniref:CubicO group peptidase (Beta-lactamase class C family) n=1 Tax=Cecembia rubra TaxID=1485585 RepID=A0A2P8EEV5_9BACT|nr:serine hydrolase domain-containing protein [Cecembia rubra]PSL07995.1 CubicO group peptidase (beta-lactamase class C family) [Cecembia rubra]